MTQVHQVLLYGYVLLVNLYAFILCGLDKSAAVKRRRRVPESTLLLTAALGGSLGLFLAMQLFRHKTKHLKFVILVPVFFILQTALLYWIAINKS